MWTDVACRKPRYFLNRKGKGGMAGCGSRFCGSCLHSMWLPRQRRVFLLASKLVWS